jgi:ADP-ribose pyrophosphatase YjhB (NUDIX family)
MPGNCQAYARQLPGKFLACTELQAHCFTIRPEVLNMEPRWLIRAKELQAIAQNGLTYAKDQYDIERYTRLREIAAEMMAEQGGMDENALLSIFTREEGYATPKVDVRGVVFRGDELLLVREKEDGLWTLPGGWADPNESLREAVVREVWEESGFETEAVKVLAIFDRARHGHRPFYPFHVYKIFVMCELLGGKATPSMETTEVEFFTRDNLPSLSPARVTVNQIDRLFYHHIHADLPADFD